MAGRRCPSLLCPCSLLSVPLLPHCSAHCNRSCRLHGQTSFAGQCADEAAGGQGDEGVRRGSGLRRTVRDGQGIPAAGTERTTEPYQRRKGMDACGSERRLIVRTRVMCMRSVRVGDLVSLHHQRQVDQQLGSIRVRLEPIDNGQHAFRQTSLGCLDRVDQLERCTAVCGVSWACAMAASSDLPSFAAAAAAAARGFLTPCFSSLS